jgi:MFS family permease
VRHALGPVAALLCSVAILLTGQGLQQTLLPVRGQMETFSTLSLGALGAGYFLGFAAGCLLGPQLVRRAGHIRTFTAMTAIASAAPLLHSLLVMAPSWAVLRMVSGFCFAVLYIVIESWLNERSTNETRGLVLSAYLVINLTVMTLGQMLITTYSPDGFELFVLASVIVSLAAVPIALSSAVAPAPVRSVRVRPLHIYRVSPVAFAGTFGVGLSNGAWWSLAPLFAQRVGLDLNGIALFLSATVIGGAIGQWPLGRLSDRTDRRHVLVGVCLLAAATGGTILAVSASAGHWMLLLGGIWGAFAFPLYSIAVAHANDFAQPDEFVEVSSGLLLVYAAGAVFGPILASGLMSATSAAGLYAMTAGIHLLVAVFAIWRITRRPPAPTAEHVTFAEALQAAQTVSPVFDSELQVEIEATTPRHAEDDDPVASEPRDEER